MTRLVAKVVLLILVFGFAVFPALAVILMLRLENAQFEWTMLIPFGITVLGIISTIFHAKTLVFYKQLKEQKILTSPNQLLLGLNLGFAVVLFLLALWFTYIILEDLNNLPNEALLLALIFMVMPSIIGGAIFFEVFFIRKKLKESKQSEVLLEIDAIKGDNQKTEAAN